MSGSKLQFGWLSSRGYRQLVNPLIVALVMALAFSAFVRASFAAGSDRFLCLSSSSQAQNVDEDYHSSLIEHCALCFVSVPSASDEPDLPFSKDRSDTFSKLKPAVSPVLSISLSIFSNLIRGPPIS